MESVLIGKIINTHGVKGEVKIYPYTDDIDSLSKKLKVIYLDERLTKKYNVTCRIQKNMLLAKIAGIDDVDVANTLRGKNIYIDGSALDELEDDSYYIKDLIGLEVISKENNETLGTLEYVFNTGANDVYEVKTKDGKTIYLPAIKQVVQKVDIEQKKIYVEIMEGLI